MKWRIANNSQCNVCDQDEDYLHYFIHTYIHMHICISIFLFIFVSSLLFWSFCTWLILVIYSLTNKFLILIWKNFGWIFTTNFEKKINIENVVTVKHIIFGYKIFDQYYFDFNYFLAILGFSIYSTKLASL
jgi:hypothetical protein